MEKCNCLRYFSKCSFSVLFTILFLVPDVQANKTDSLKAALLNAQDTNKINILIDLSYLLRRSDAKGALGYGTEALQLSQQQGYQLGEARALNKLSLLYRYKGNLDRADSVLRKARFILRALNKDYDLAQNYLYTGLIYDAKGKYDLALEEYNEALKIFEQLAKPIDQAKIINNIGTVYRRKGLLKESRKYFFQALRIIENTGFEQNIADYSNNIAIIYVWEEKHDSAMIFYQRALKAYTQIDHKSGKALVLNNLANLYNIKGNYQKAIEYCKRSLKISEKTGDKSNQMLSLNNIGMNYHSLENFQESLWYLNQALELLNNMESKSHSLTVYNSLITVYKENGDYKNALKYLKLLRKTKMKILVEEEKELKINLREKYESDKKEQELALLKNKNEIQKITLNRQKTHVFFLSLSVLILASLVYVSYKRFLLRKRALAILEQQNKIIEEKNREMNNTIHYAEKIQKAILPDNDEFKKLFPQSFILNKPKDILSGDFFWSCQKEGKYILVVGDCEGHGVPGSMMTMVAIMLLENVVNILGVTQPSDILLKMHKLLRYFFAKKEQGNNFDLMDIMVCSYDPKKSELNISCANNPIYLLGADRENTILEIQGCKHGLGGDINQEFYEFFTETIKVRQNSVYLATDGFRDQFGGPKNKKYTRKRLQILLSQISGLPIDEQKKTTEIELSNWMNGTLQTDDILVVGLKFN